MDRMPKLRAMRMVTTLVLALALAIAALALSDIARADTKTTTTALLRQPMQGGGYDCDKPTTRNKYAYGKCWVGQGVSVRLRADCRYAIDRYSNWKTGGGTRYFRTINPCGIGGIRGGIWQVSEG